MSKSLVVMRVGWGDLIDRITILRIKSQRIPDDGRRANVLRELALCAETRDLYLFCREDLQSLEDRLFAINQNLWEIEDSLRVHERDGDFGPSFVALARNVYKTNDVRAQIKKEINDLMDSAVREEKFYSGCE